MIAGLFLVGLSRSIIIGSGLGFGCRCGPTTLFVGGILGDFDLHPAAVHVRLSTRRAQRTLRDTFFAAFHPQGALLFELLVFAALVILAPLLEEMVFRGLFFGWARQRPGLFGRGNCSAL